MNFKTTVFLLVILLVVGVFFFWMQQKSPPQPVPTSPATTVRSEGQPLWTTPPLSLENITTIELVRNAQTLAFAKEGSDWWQVKPVRFALNAWSARDLMESALSLRYVERFAPDGRNNPTLSEVSLQPPLATLTLSDGRGSGKSIVLNLGRTSVGGRGYLSLGQEPTVYVVNNRLHIQVLEGELLGYRKKTLNMPGFADLASLSLKTPDGLVEATKTPQHWVFTGTHSGRIDADALSGLVGSVTGLFINKFVQDNPDDGSVYGLHDPHYEVVLTTSRGEGASEQTATQPVGGKVYRLRIGSPTDLSLEKFFATFTRDDADPAMEGLVVFEVNRSDVEKLRKKVEDLRDPRLVTVTQSAVQSMTFTPASGSAITLAKSPEGWVFASPQPDYAIDRVEVLRVLDRWITARATGFTTETDAALSPVYTVQLAVEGQSDSITMRLYDAADSDELWLVHVQGEGLGYRVPKATLPLVSTPLAFRDRTVLALTATELQRIEITRPDQPVVVLQRRATTGEGEQNRPGAWELRGQESYEPFAVDELIRQLTPLKAQSWLETLPTALDPAQAIMLQLTLAKGDPMTLTVDPATRQARLDKVETAFVMTPELLSALQATFSKVSPLVMPEQELLQK